MSQDFYSEDVKGIYAIDFSVLTNKDTLQYSAVKNDTFGIIETDYVDGTASFTPLKGGLNDSRLGTTDPYIKCSTCGEDSNNCPGHFGHTELAQPIFNYAYINTIKSILNMVCHSCSELLIENKNDKKIKQLISKQPQSRFKEISAMTKGVTNCYNCGAPVYSVEVKKEVLALKIRKIKQIQTQDINEVTGNMETFQKLLSEDLTPKIVWDIFRNIKDEDCAIIGLNPKISRPEDMIYKILPISPLATRPSSKFNANIASASQDRLTQKLNEIIKYNKLVKQQLERHMDDRVSDYSNLLQYHAITYYNHNAMTSTGQTGTPTSIADRVEGKYGRVRGNLIGKRVNFSGRSVITPDAYINIDQIGMPLRIAMELTIPEEVTALNIKKLAELVVRGRDNYPGANFIQKRIRRGTKYEYQRRDLRYSKKDLKLEIGDIIERHVQDGDYVLFNRQPTLHRPSMMGHRVHIIPDNKYNTFRLNVSATGPYNADYDGDEMNAFLAQSIQARNELKYIADIKNQIIGVRNSEPIIGCVVDTIAGAYLMTEKDTKMYGWEAASLLCNTSTKDKIKLDMNKEYSGSEVFSYIIPDGITKRDGGVRVINGKLLEGNLSKSTLSTAKNSLIHFIVDKYGSTEGQKFIDNSQRLVLNYLMRRGITTHYYDCVLNDDLTQKVNDIIDGILTEVKYMITKYEDSNIEYSNDYIEELLLDKITTEYGNVSMLVDKALDSNNIFWLAKKSGAKSKTDIAKIISSHGQLVIGGSTRLGKSIQGRSMIYNFQNDDRPLSRGFIKHSFSEGLNGPEYFISANAARDGFVKTALSTADTGYIQRKLIRALEDVSIRYDGTNRGSRGAIIQLAYGDNGINQSTQSQVILNVIELNNKDVEEKLGLSDKEISKISTKVKISKAELEKLNKTYVKSVIELRDIVRKNYHASQINYKTIDDKYWLPVNLKRIIETFNEDKEHIELDPKYILSEIDDFLNDINYKIICLVGPNDKYMKENDSQIKLIFKLALLEYLSPKKCIFEYGLSKTKFDEMMNDIKISLTKSLVEPGEMVGIVAGQSIGEPTTQMQLDAKHTSGKKTEAGSGLERIKEILGNVPMTKNPRMHVFFDKEISKDYNKVNKITSSFKYISYGELVKSGEILIDMGVGIEHNRIKADNVSNPIFMGGQKAELEKMPFVFRFVINETVMIEKEVSLLDIKTRFFLHWRDNFESVKTMNKEKRELFSSMGKCAILSNTTADKETIIHIRFSYGSFNMSILIALLNIFMNEVTLKGMPNIDDVDTKLELNVRYDKDGNKISEKEYMCDVVGINYETLKTYKNIDLERTYVNDIRTIYNMYGIEAARQMLINQINRAYSLAGTNVNQNHLSVLIDQMCYSGDIISIDRHGLKKIDTDIMAKAAFESTLENFVTASVYNERDTMRSNASRTIMGQAIRGGTGAFDLVFDTEKVASTEYTKNEKGGIQTYIPLEEEEMFKDLENIGTRDFIIPT